MFGRDVQLLSVVRSVVGQLGPHAFPATEVRRLAFVDACLDVVRQRKEGLDQSEVPVEELVIDAVIGEEEEADLVADADHPIGERRSIGCP